MRTPSTKNLRLCLAACAALLLTSATHAQQPGKLPAEAPMPQVVDAESPCVQGDPPIFKVGVPAHAPVTGDRDGALVTIVVFSEFQCPYCARVVGTLGQVLDAYPKEVRLVYRNNPLPFHKDALPAAKAAMAAARQGRFWEMHDKLFENKHELDEDHLFGHASKLGLDMQRFTAEFASEAVAGEIQADMDEARNLGARGVPTFFVNGRELTGARPFGQFKALIDELLPAARRAGGKGDELYQRLTACGLTTKPDRPRRPLDRPRPRRPQEDPDKIHVVPVGDAYVAGAKDAQVTVIHFSDFQCPYCARGARTLAELLDAYPKKVRVVFKHMPLGFHKDAFLAHQAALAAGAQGKFWEMHDVLFQNQRRLKREHLEEYALELGLNLVRFKGDLDTGAHRQVIEADQAQAKELGARGTPTFYINGKKLVGAQPLPRFKEKVDQALGR